MNSERNVLKNSIEGVLSLGLGSLLQLLIFSLLARYLGTVGFGQYSYIMAFVGTFQLFAEMGLTLVLVRDITLDKKNVNKYIGQALPLLWVLAIGTLALIILAARLFHLAPELSYPLYIAGIATVATIQPNIYVAVFRAFESMEINNLGFVLQKVFFLGLVYLLVIKGRGQVISSFLALAGANLLVWFFYYLCTIRKYGRSQLRINFRYWVSLLKEAIPLGFGSILRKITWQVDTLILGVIDTAVSVALYNSAYRLLAALNMLPQVLAISMFPYFTRLAENSQDDFAKVYQKSLKFLWILSLPIAIVTTVLADRIILLFFGSSYEGAAAALKILIWASIFLFLSSQYKHIFTILHKQHLYTYLVIFALIVNAGLDLILIPLFSYIGACFATLITEILLYVAGCYLLRRLGVSITLITHAVKPVLGGFITGAILYLVRDIPYLLLGLVIIVDFGLYFALLFSFGTFSQGEIDRMLRLVKRS